MKLHKLCILLTTLGCACATPINDAIETEKHELTQEQDLKTEASSAYGRRYIDWGGYPSASGYSGYGVTGYGTLDDKYNNYNSYYGGYGGGYDNTYGYNGYSSGSPGYSGYSGNAGYGGYDYNGYKRYGGYSGSNGVYSGSNGGYGGYGGNGGLVSYYGYNSPYNQGAYHLGYGYYNKSPGNIYTSGVTPSLVTGYRGYSRR